MKVNTQWTPSRGRFGSFGGRFAGELLEAPLAELESALDYIVETPAFQRELLLEAASWAGRPTPLTFAPRLSEECGLQIWLKREDLLHGGAHKTNNVIGQGLLARELGKKRLIAETGAGQHGVAVAMIAARLGLESVVYMGAQDVARQRLNVERMRLFGAEVRPVSIGAGTLKEAIDEAMRDWTATFETTHYLLGTVCGPDPFPRMVRRFQQVIGEEARAQILEEIGAPPDAAVACVGGGSNAIGLFSGFLEDPTRLFGVEPEHGASVSGGEPGLLHGTRTLVLQDRDGQVRDAHSIAPGLDYPGVGPEHAALRDRGRVNYVTVSDREAVEAFAALSRLEGILPALESSHAVACLRSALDRQLLEAGASVVVNLSGRGDKDMDTWERICAGAER